MDEKWMKKITDEKIKWMKKLNKRMKKTCSQPKVMC
jgi:hypothetical protein